MFTTRDPLDGVPGTPTQANPYHYADNDPNNKTDPAGERPTEKCASGEEREECARIVSVLNAYYPSWGKFNLKVGTCGRGSTDPGSNNGRVLCVGEIYVRESWRSGGTYSNLAQNPDEAFAHVVLHELGHTFVRPYTYDERNAELGLPSIYDARGWPDYLASGDGQLADSLRLDITGLNWRAESGGRSLVDELLADCVAENFLPETKGGYWYKYVHQVDHCTPAGRDAARKMQDAS